MRSSRVGDKSICLPFESEVQYKACIKDTGTYRQYMKEIYESHPELFPEAIGYGYKFYGYVCSKKQTLRMRRIKLKKNKAVYQIRPSFIMPYMIGKTDNIEKALYLLKWGVPFDALAYVFGRDAMYWYRAYLSLGRNSIVGTTVKDPAIVPKDLAADEKHTWLEGKKIYVAATAAQGCILGAGLATAVTTEALAEAYSDFQQEALDLNPSYQPQTVNTDGWESTQKAWRRLFPQITLMLCFLHAFFKVRDCCKRYKGLYLVVSDMIWKVFEAAKKAQFSQRIRRLREFICCVCDKVVRQKVFELCGNAARFKSAFDFPSAYRTSNAVDRLMNYQDRLLYAMQYFHGTNHSARLYLRAMALVWNFHPYGTKTRLKYPNRFSPFQDLNGFRYHDNWLHNLLIAASMRGWRNGHIIR